MSRLRLLKYTTVRTKLMDIEYFREYLYNFIIVIKTIFKRKDDI